MAAPTVSRPLNVPVNENKSQGMLSMADAVLWVRRVVMTCAILGIVALAVVTVSSWNETERTSHIKQQWDEVYKALKDKVKPDDRMAALESVAEKVKGSTAHAYVLMELGHLYLEKSLKPEKNKEERDAALKNSIEIYKLVASTEPYRSNSAFGPIATGNAALAMEQAEDYDGAIELLNASLDFPKIKSHFLYNKMVAQLGRLYWLRSLKKSVAGSDAQTDRNAAKSKLAEVLRFSNSKDEQKEKWREQAEYIRSLLDNPGKGLPDGKAPPVKPKKDVSAKPEVENPEDPEFKTKKEEEKSDKAKPRDEAKEKADGINKDEPKIDETKKDEIKSEEPKKDGVKEEKSKEDKKESGMLDTFDNAETSTGIATTTPSEHLSFSQIQKLLKEGKTSFCRCPRCINGEKPAASKLVE